MRMKEKQKKFPVSSEALDQLISQVKDPTSLSSVEDLCKSLKKSLIERLLETEMTHHLGYAKHSKREEGGLNYRNGHTSKTVLAGEDEVDIQTPRDRGSTFQPVIVPKGIRRLEGFDDRVISLYARGLSVREIQGHIKEIYQVDISPDLISTITDEVLEEVREWQSRPLETLYAIVVFDCLFIKTRHEGMVKNRAYYLAMGYTLDGEKDILGLWVEETEGAKFWLKVMTELRNRGVQDILIACIDGLKGFGDAIHSIFPHAQIQGCIVHQIRYSLNFVSWKERKAVAHDLKDVYKADSEEEALHALEAFKEKWDTRYPSISASWERNWEKIIPFLSYPPAVRKVIYTTNAIESLNMALRKIIKNRGHFPSQEAACKLLFLALKRHQQKNWRKSAPDWGQARTCFYILFGERIQKAYPMAA